MRNMSFSLTTDQVRRREKTVTRRLGWRFLKPGDFLSACVKCQGLKLGEKVERLTTLKVTDVRRERLNRMMRDPAYGQEEAAKEGFPGLDGLGFVMMFCREMKASPADEVTRVAFRYVSEHDNYRRKDEERPA